MHILPIILGSSSIFRQQQLQKLGILFEVAKPTFDETPYPSESAHDTALRLAIGKAQSLVNTYPQHLIIGADQVAFCNNQQLGKPMSVAKAQQMLTMLSGQCIDFHSAIVLLNSSNGTLHQYVDTTQVKMRSLSQKQINRYLEQEPDAIYCAGAAKSEGLGACLIESIHSTDPNALIGLPIFSLINFLELEGISIL